MSEVDTYYLARILHETLHKCGPMTASEIEEHVRAFPLGNIIAVLNCGPDFGWLPGGKWRSLRLDRGEGLAKW